MKKEKMEITKKQTASSCGLCTSTFTQTKLPSESLSKGREYHFNEAREMKNTKNQTASYCGLCNSTFVIGRSYPWRMRNLKGLQEVNEEKGIENDEETNCKLIWNLVFWLVNPTSLRFIGTTYLVDGRIHLILTQIVKLKCINVNESTSNTSENNLFKVQTLP